MRVGRGEWNVDDLRASAGRGQGDGLERRGGQHELAVRSEEGRGGDAQDLARAVAEEDLSGLDAMEPGQLIGQLVLRFVRIAPRQQGCPAHGLEGASRGAVWILVRAEAHGAGGHFRLGRESGEWNHRGCSAGAEKLRKGTTGESGHDVLRVVLRSLHYTTTAGDGGKAECRMSNVEC